LLKSKEEGDYDLRIADFGLSGYIKEGSIGVQASGTPGFVAPEMLKGQGYNHNVDCFSAGVLLFYLATGGQAVFQAKTCKEMISKNKKCVTSGALMRLPKLSSAGLKSFLKELLQADPARRPSSAKALQNEWFND
jgi:serine/threonine protein kinase